MWNFSARERKYSLKSDEELMRAAARGDEEAFVTLYRRHQADLFRFAWHMNGCEAAAEEAVQETFLALLRSPAAWNPERGTVRAFLFGIARNQVLRQIGGRRQVDVLDADIRIEDDLLENLTKAERVAAVQDAVASLPAVYREVAVLCGIEQVSYEDAALLLGCPVGTVRSRLSRARHLLACKLKAQMPERVK